MLLLANISSLPDHKKRAAFSGNDSFCIPDEPKTTVQRGATTTLAQILVPLTLSDWA